MRTRKVTYIAGGALLCIALVAIPLTVKKEAGFTGTDDKAKDAIAQTNPHYKPWASNFLPTFSDEVSSMFFALQAAIGAGIIGYGLGYLRGSKRKDSGNK